MRSKLICTFVLLVLLLSGCSTAQDGSRLSILPQAAAEPKQDSFRFKSPESLQTVATKIESTKPSETSPTTSATKAKSKLTIPPSSPTSYTPTTPTTITPTMPAVGSPQAYYNPVETDPYWTETVPVEEDRKSTRLNSSH